MISSSIKSGHSPTTVTSHSACSRLAADYQNTASVSLGRSKDESAPPDSPTAATTGRLRKETALSRPDLLVLLDIFAPLSFRLAEKPKKMAPVKKL